MLAAAHEGAPSTAVELELQRVEQRGPAMMHTTEDEAEGARLVDGVSSSGEPRVDNDPRRVRFAEVHWGGAAVPNWWAALRSVHRKRLIAFVLLSGLGYLVVAMVMLVSYRRRHAYVFPSRLHLDPRKARRQGFTVHSFQRPLRVWALVRGLSNSVCPCESIKGVTHYPVKPTHFLGYNLVRPLKRSASLLREHQVVSTPARAGRTAWARTPICPRLSTLTLCWSVAVAEG